MHLFLAIYDEEIAAEIKEQASSKFPPDGIYQLSGHILLVSSPINDSKYVSTLLGFPEGDVPSNVGIVFRLNGSYYGNYYSLFWDWIKKAREASG